MCESLSALILGSPPNVKSDGMLFVVARRKLVLLLLTEAMLPIPSMRTGHRCPFKTAEKDLGQILSDFYGRGFQLSCFALFSMMQLVKDSIETH